MDNSKKDKNYSEKIIKDLTIIFNNTKDLKKDDLKIDSLLCDSILFRIIQISESSEKLSENFKSKFPNIPWRAIKGLRNKIVHEYGNINVEIIYKTIKDDIPMLLKTMIASLNFWLIIFVFVTIEFQLLFLVVL